MKFKRLIALALVGGVVAGGLSTADAKKKVVLKASQQKYFMRWDGDGQTCGANFLSVKDAPDGGNGCEFTFQPAQEVLIASGQGALARDWAARDGLPFVLNTAKPIKGQINVFEVASVAGQLEIVLSGMSGGSAVELGSKVVDVPTAPMDVATVEFAIKPPKKFNKKIFTGFNMNLVQRGVALSYMELDDPASSVTIPTFKRR